MKFVTPALRMGSLPAAIALAMVPSLAVAQDTDAGATTLDRMEVTGSRIRGADMETQQPIVTLSREALEQQGYTSVVDVLQNLTAAGSPAISRSDALASGENVGGYYIDLRNLGANRTLVLMNGKRLGATSGGYQDLSQVPMAAVERIEVLKDGASSIYGSDAIGGVINVITRKRYTGAEVSAYAGEYGQGDGQTTNFAATVGKDFGRGSVTVAAEYNNADPVWAKDRWFSADGAYGPGTPKSTWSAVSQNGSWCDPRQHGDCFNAEGKPTVVWQTLNPGGNPLNAADYAPITSESYANSNQQMMLSTGIERKSLFVNGTFDITDAVSLNTDVIYNERTTDQQIAGYPYQSQAFDTPLAGASAFNPIGQDLEFRRRLWEAPRTTESELKTVRVAPSLTGWFDAAGRTFDWNVGAMWNRNELTKTSRGEMSLIAARQALGASFIDADGVARCGTAAAPIDGCLAWNPLLPYGVAGAGSLADRDLQAFLFPVMADKGVTETTLFTADIAGSIMTLPAGDLGFAVGVEHRKEEGTYTPDAFAQTGEFTGLASDTTAGEYDLNEIYLELNIPVLADMAFARELTVNLASRYSDYSNFGSTTNSKAGFTWRPVDELLVRATYAEGFRAPSIDNMYGGTGASFSSYTDPCSVGVAGSVAGNAACTAAGVSPTFVQLTQGLEPCASWPCQTPDVFTSGSNPALNPETSKSRTVGLVWSPRWVTGLDLSLDWFNYQISDMIIADSPDRILRDCYIYGDASRCGSFTRDPSTGHINSMFYGLANLGEMETQGFDVGVKYRLPELAIGSISFDWQTTYVSKYDQSAVNADGETIMIGYVGTPGIFRTRSNLGVNWSKGDWAVNWTARYYSGMAESCISLADGWCDRAERYANGEWDPQRTTGSNTFHDVQVSYKAPWDATIAIGANNVFGHYGSLQYTAPLSSYSYYGGFDIGRTVYMKYTQKF